VIAPNGIGKKPFWKAIAEGKSGIGRITRFDPSEFPTQIAGEVNDFDPTEFMEAKEARRIDRFSQLGIAASVMAVRDAGLDLEKEDRSRIGVFLGAAAAGLGYAQAQYDTFREKGYRRINPHIIYAAFSDACAGNISLSLGVKGPSTTIAAACASGTASIELGLNAIRNREAELVLAGGADAPITSMIVASYCAASAMSTRNDEPPKASRPYCLDRDGFVLAEGAGIIVLEDLDRALRRGAHIYAELAGFGMTCDSYHMTQSAPEGEEAARAIRLALKDAQIDPRAVDYINAHGTSTPINDKVETMVIKKVFGDHAYNLSLSSIKSMIGHTHGACGGIETIGSILSIENQTVPPTINYDKPDPECDLDYVPNRCRQGRVNTVLKTSFGFGGKNAALVLKRLAMG
jgi:3-oxoacyl-[acyl-carrier-protein] synthase II